MDKRDFLYNPSDENASTPGGRFYGYIIDVKDPKKQGRVLVQPIGGGEGFKGAGECQWVTVNMTHGGRKGGAIGMSPPSAGLVPSDVVTLSTLGQQTWEVTGVVSKVDENDQTGDIHPHAKEKQTKFTNENHNSNPGEPGYTLTSYLEEWVKEAKENFFGQFGKSRRWLNAQIPAANRLGDWVQGVLRGQIPSDFSFRKTTRNKNKAQGMEQYKGILDDATRFMQQVQMPPIFSSSFSMIQNLQNTARSGQNINHFLSVGGAQNVTTAIQQASSYFSQINKENEENEKDPIKAYLYKLYREETGKEPLDENGNETEDYKAWEIEYYLKEQYIEETGLEPLNENGKPTSEYLEWKLNQGLVS
jgi:hypothetical protein